MGEELPLERTIMRPRGPLLLWIVCSVIASAKPAYSGSLSIHEVFDPSTGNTEHRLFDDAFHFGTLIKDPDARLIFRPHPDQEDVNGFGTSWFMNPFLAGAEPGFGNIGSLMPTASAIAIVTDGQVARVGGTYGTWALNGTVSYDPEAQIVSVSGTLSIQLDDTLSAVGADLNLERLSSNFLKNVPLQTGGAGDTGDMSLAVVTYSANGDPRDFIWIPFEQTSHFPQDFSGDLCIGVVGQTNTVDTEALGEGFQIEIARKPTVTLTFESDLDQMIAGLTWDESQAQSFAADNVGINHLFLKSDTLSRDFTLTFDFESSVIGESSACQFKLCGDADDSGSVDPADAAALRAFLADPAGRSLDRGGFAKCSVIGERTDCDVADIVVLRRFLADPQLPPGLAPVCVSPLVSS